MLFFDNPGGKRHGGKRRRSGKRAKARKRRVRVVRRVARSHSIGGDMAKRARSRKRRHSRRRRSGGTAAVALRRRGVTVYRSNPRHRRRRRHSYSRNPGGAIITTIKQGVKDGAVILVSQIATKKGLDIASKYVPVQGIAGAAIVGLGVPVIVAMISRKAVPSQSRLVTAAAFAEGVRHVLATTPVGGFLADVVNQDYQSSEYGAWPAPQIAANMGAYPGAMGDYEEQYVQ